MTKFCRGEIELDVPEGVYYPEEDSFLMADVLEGTDMEGKKVLDMGCGSGFLSVMCAMRGGDITAADITEEAVEATRANATANGAKLHAFASDLFGNVSEKFDIIIFNPPYLPKDGDEEGHITYTGGATGRETIERFVLQCKEHLAEGGKMLLLISSLTGKDEVLALLNESGFSAKTVAKRKIDWEEICVIEAAVS